MVCGAGNIPRPRFAAFGDVAVDHASRCREYATQCVRMASETEDEKQKLVLLQMAQHWIALADDAARDPPHNDEPAQPSD